VPDYDTIDPTVYQGRFDRSPREGYLLDHWRPITEAAIERYCRGKRALDLGCGFGDYTHAIGHADVVIGVDLSDRWLRHAREVTGIRNVVRANALHVPFQTEAFDAILSVGLLEYVDPDQVIREIARLLVPGGYCVVVSPNKFSAFRMVLRLMLKLRGRPYDCRESSLAELEEAMRDSGIEPIDVQMDDGLVWLPDFVDRRLGRALYGHIERGFRLLGRNPVSNEMLIVGQRRA
jgi:SAM-dependent methyltransferase